MRETQQTVERPREAAGTEGGMPWPHAMKQKQAAAYLGMAVSTFREAVDVAPVPVTLPRPGRPPILRYRRADLDAWVERCANHRLRKPA